MKLILSLLLSVCFCMTSFCGNISVKPEEIVIVSGKENLEEANDLAKHFGLIFGKKPPVTEKAESGKYIFRFVSDPSEKAQRGLCSIEIGDRETVLTGYSGAAYWFLQKKMGVTWVCPGDTGILFSPMDRLNMETGRTSFEPILDFRQIRPSLRIGKYNPNLPKELAPYAEFKLSKERYDIAAEEETLWRKRHRMGGLHPNYGHAFTDWWDKYAKAHPDYFALNKYGKREPEERVRTGNFSARDKSFVKVCASNPEVAAQTVENWKVRGMRGSLLNVCMNDMPQGFCRCEKCLALDGYGKNEKLPDYLPYVTDRYVFLANEAAKRVAALKPGTRVVMYAYESSLEPPKHLKVAPEVNVAVVPTEIDAEGLEALYGGWKKAGATYFAVRPNYHFYYMKNSIPLGFEKQMFDAFQTAYRNGTRAVDYDHIMPNWAVSAFTDYTLARTFLEPDLPFETIEKEFMASYGNAAPEMTEYYRYWRNNVWEKRILPDYRRIVELGRFHNFIRGLYWSKLKYYRESDFDETDVILARAAKKQLSTAEKERLRQVELANRQARLFFRAVSSSGQDRNQAALDLLAFRKENNGKLNLDFLDLFSLEARFNATAVDLALDGLSKYKLPWIETGLAWKFRFDKENKGLSEKWQNLTDSDLKKDWSLRTDSPWTNPYRSETDPVLYREVRNYSGTAWYFLTMRTPPELKGKNVILFFPSFIGSCEVFVNGQKSGEFSTEGGSAEAAIGKFVGDSPEMRIALRCTGKGGIAKRVWIVGPQ